MKALEPSSHRVDPESPLGRYIKYYCEVVRSSILRSNFWWDITYRRLNNLEKNEVGSSHCWNLIFMEDATEYFRTVRPLC